MSELGEEPLAPDSPQLADAAAAWRSAYVHVPFCRKRCPYCDFAVVTPQEQPPGSSVHGYVDALRTEIGMEPEWEVLDAVNFGGGTPSTLEPDSVARILTALRDRFGIESGAEISLEANPEDMSEDLAAAFAKAGVNRISLGVQSFDGAVLQSLGRTHDPETAAAAVRACRRGGIAAVSLDLIFGTPGETLDSWGETLARALALDPEHLSTYALTVERGTELSRRVVAGATAPDPDLQADMYDAATERAAAAGLVRYEVSNFARPGHPCRYNLSTWAQGEYVAFGLGAHGHRNGVRRRNVRRLDRYMGAVRAGRRPEAGADVVVGWMREQERLLLGLRRTAGVVAGRGGAVLWTSEAGRRLAAAGILGRRRERIIVLRPLLTDEVNRAVLGVTEPALPPSELSLAGEEC